jgi:hypothetical protein
MFSRTIVTSRMVEALRDCGRGAGAAAWYRAPQLVRRTVLKYNKIRRGYTMCGCISTGRGAIGGRAPTVLSGEEGVLYYCNSFVIYNYFSIQKNHVVYDPVGDF